MQVTKQQSLNECGVCVINSFVKHFYKCSDKLKILNEANITNHGLSIFDFENLGQKFGLYIESYECEWSEFCSLKNNHYYALLIQKNDLMHYIIIYKTRQEIVVYDSDSGKYQLLYNQFKKYFAGIVFEVSKSKVKIKYDKQKINLYSIDLKFLLICLLLHMCVIGFSTLFANILNWTLNLSVYSQSTQNLIYLCFIFAIIVGLNTVTNYIIRHYSLIRFKQNFRYLTCKLIDSLKNKNLSLLNKVDPNGIYLLDSSIVSIGNFLTVEIASLITECIMFLITLIILIFIKPLFLIICLISVCISLFFGVLNYHFKEKNLIEIIKNSNFNNQQSRLLMNSMLNEENSELLNFNIEKYKDNFFKFEKIYTSKSLFDNSVTSFESLSNNIIYVFTIVIGAFYLINQKMNIGTLTFLVSLLGMFSSAINNIFAFPTKNKEYKKMSDIYWSFVNLSNVVKDSYIKNTDEITSIEFLFKDKKVKVERNTILNNDLASSNNFVGFNGVSKQNKSFFKTNFIKINPDSNISKDYILNEINSNKALFQEIFNFFKLDLTKKKHDLHEKQIINFIFTCLQKNKIICFNNCFKYLSLDEQNYVKEKINEVISKNNFVFYVEN